MNAPRLILAALRLILFLALAVPSPAQQLAYQHPPKEVLDILRAPLTPGVSLSPTRDRLLLVEPEGYPSIAEVSQPMLGLAGMRINPRNNGPHRVALNTSLQIQAVPGGEQLRVKLPSEARFGFPLWSPDGKQFAFALHQPNRIELWVADARTGRARRLSGVTLNAAYGTSFQWMPDNHTLLCRTVPDNRGPEPALPLTPPGPNVQESDGRKSPARTYEDLLKDAHDDDLFEHYYTAQLLLVDSTSSARKKVGRPALYSAVDSAPDGQHILVSILKRPFSRILPASGFARDVLVIDRQGNPVYKLASLPSHEGVPLNGVLPGPRTYQWRPTGGATLIWVEAVRRSTATNSGPRITYRDRLVALKAPFTNAPSEIMRLEHRYSGLMWGERDGLALVSDFNSDKRWRRTYLINADNTNVAPRLVWERSTRDRYKDPGDPLFKTLPSGDRVIWQSGNAIYLSGAGASPRGDYPFLDRFDLGTFETQRIFQCADRTYEYIVALVDDDAKGGLRYITRHETADTPPNYLLHSGGATAPLTRFADPQPQLRKITKQLVTYKRDDGVSLSFTLYLPPDYQPGTRLPTLVWAYPLEYNDAETAGQVSGSTNRFTTVRGASHLFFLTQGYAHRRHGAHDE
jgi:dipeptidyl aminopeptidase/acylaminoacyl peptidase